MQFFALVNRLGLTASSLLPLVVLLTPADLGAQTAPKVFYACYDPNAGVVYRIKEPGLLQQCLSFTHRGQTMQHIEFSWTDGLGALRKEDAAGGDLAGTYPNPTVHKIQGTAVSATPPTAGQFLGFDGTSWVAAAAPTGITAEQLAAAGAEQRAYTDQLATAVNSFRSIFNSTAITTKNLQHVREGDIFVREHGSITRELRWPNPWVDANYTVTCSIDNRAFAGEITMHLGITAKTPEGVLVVITNATGRIQDDVRVGCIAVHD